MDAVVHLIRLRATLVRLAHEVEAMPDCMSGKGAPRARGRAVLLANRMRDAAMAPDLVAVCSTKRVPDRSIERMQDFGTRVDAR